MKSTRKFAAVAWIAVVLSSLGACADISRRDADTAIGAAVGGVAGSVLSNGSGLGTVGGAVVGGVIGNQVGKRR
jgi:osmotically inducible lipoprotein OsmB